MNKELIVRKKDQQIEIALLEENLLVELHQELTESKYAVGDVFLAKVKRTIPGLNAAFIDVGGEKEGFLHYTDLGPQLKSFNKFVKESINGAQNTHHLTNFKQEPDIIKTGKMSEVLKRGQLILAQVLKEPISTKGPRITSEVTLAGRYVVLVPFSDAIAVSRKIKSKDERKRLEVLGQSIKPPNFGLIIRTVAESKKVQEINKDVENLLKKWENIHKTLFENSKKVPFKVLGEISKTTTILRDILNDSFNKIVVNDPILETEVINYVSGISPNKKNIVSTYSNKRPIFEHYGVNKQIKSSFGKTVNMSGGAYLVIEHTEAMHVIDVNSGHKMRSNTDQESSALAVNMLAASEIARQLRLRDLGGLIVIDFIDMRQAENKKILVRRMREIMEADRAKHTILSLSKFGLMEITRQRVRPELQISTAEICPTCEGSGKVQPTTLVTDHIYEDLSYLFQELNYKQLTLAVHPFIAAYLEKGWLSIARKWMWEFKKRFTIIADPNMAAVAYKFINTEGEEIEL